MVKAQRPSARSRAPSGVRSASYAGRCNDMVCSPVKAGVSDGKRSDATQRQNIPKPDGDVYHLREAFIPKHGYMFVVFDYSQLEMRLLAHESHDKNMIDVINRGWDIHAGTACVMYSYDYDELNKARKKKKNPQAELSDLEWSMCMARDAAKAIGFGRPTC